MNRVYEFPSRTIAALPYRRGRLSIEHRVDRRLGAFLTIGTGHAHRADDLAIDHDGKRARLWEVAHEDRRQILAAPDHLVGLRGGRRQRKADFAFNSAVSIAFIGAASIAWDSMRLPPQSRIAMATICLFCSAQAVQASAKARAPALDMTLISLVVLRSLVACRAGAERACC